MDVQSLREREKELHCLYRVQRFTLDPASPVEHVFEQVVETLGPGWQRPETTGAEIEYYDQSYRSRRYQPTAPQLQEPITLSGKKIGSVKVSDCHPGEQGQELFLEEERQLLRSVASLLSNFLEWRHLEILGKRLWSVSRSHRQWRERLIQDMVSDFDSEYFGETEFYLPEKDGSEERNHGSEMDLHVRHCGTSEQKQLLRAWLDGWSTSVTQMARMQTGEVFPDGLFKLHWLNSEREDVGLAQVAKRRSDSSQEGDEVEAMVQRTLLALSHELRNPLTVVSTNLDMLKKQVPPKMKREIISEIEESVAHISGLLKNLMLFLRAETGIEKPPLEETDLEEFLGSALERIRRNVDGANILLQKGDHQRPLCVLLNRRITERILQALISNAARYSKSDKIHVSIYSEKGLETVISVKDEGCGIDEIHHDKLFEQFYRLESSRNRIVGGAGLGLPLARALARSQNSSLQLISRPGVGTDVRLIFREIE